MTARPREGQILQWERIKDLSLLEPREQLELLPGDVVFVFSDGFAGWLIRMWTRRPSDKVAVNHVAMVVKRPGTIMDAQPPIVHQRRLQPRYSNCLVAIYRAVGLTYEQRQALAARAMRYDGDYYGWTKILLQLVRLGRWACIDGLPICSYSVAVPYSEEGYSFGRGVLARAATPEQLYDGVRSHAQ